MKNEDCFYQEQDDLIEYERYLDDSIEYEKYLEYKCLIEEDCKDKFEEECCDDLPL